MKDYAYQPATVAAEPATGSWLEAGRAAYPMVELVGIGVASLRIATSKSSGSLTKLG